MKYFSIKSWEEYQHGDPNKKHYPWIKLYGTLLRRIWMRQFSSELRYWVVCLLDFSKENNNRIPENLEIFCEIYGLKWEENKQTHFLNVLVDNGFVCIPKRKVKGCSIREEEDKKRKDQEFETNFQNFWNLYPKKQGEITVRKILKSKLNKASIDEILEGVKNYNNKILENRTDEQYIRTPKNWLTDEDWKSKVLVKQQSTVLFDDDKYA